MTDITPPRLTVPTTETPPPRAGFEGTNLLGPPQSSQEPQPPPAPTNQVGSDNLAMGLLSDGRDRYEREQKDSADRDLIRMVRTFLPLDPDLAAEAKAKSLDLGLDSTLGEQDIVRLREMWEEKKLHTLIRSGGNEALYRSMMDPEFLKVARDDLDSLVTVGDTVAQWRSGRLGFALSMFDYKKLQSGGRLSDEDEAEVDRLQALSDQLPSDSAGHGIMSLWYGGARMLGGMFETAAWSAANAIAAGGTAAALGQAGPQAAFFEEVVTVPVAMGWTATTTMGVMSGRQIAGEAYGQMRRLGITHEGAKGRAQLAGFLGGALEMSSFGLVGGKIAGKALGEFMAKRVADEGFKAMTKRAAVGKFLKGAGASITGELTTELAQEFIQWELTTDALTEEGKDDSRGSRGEAMTDVFWETLRGVALLGSFGPAMSLTKNTRLAAKAVADGKWLTQLGKDVKATKLSGRGDVGAGKLKQFLEQSIEESGGPKDLIFDVDTFTEEMVEQDKTMDDLERSHPEIAAALRQADAEGVGDFEIPTAEFGAKFLLSPFGESMIPHARTQADGMTAAEGVAFEENKDALAEQGRKILEEDEKVADTFKEEAEVARKRVYGELVAAGATPREAATESAMYKSYVAVMADRLEVSPAEFEKQYGLEILGEDAAGVDGDALEQPGTPAFQEWFGESRVVDENGDPLVVYHGTNREFDSFDPGEAGVASSLDPGLIGPAFYFTESREQAGMFAMGAEFRDVKEGHATKESGAAVMPVYLSLRNPARIVDGQLPDGRTLSDIHPRGIDAKTGKALQEEFKSQGHDGVILSVGGDDVQFIAFDPAQIKSPNNRGTFDPNDPNILSAAEQKGRYHPSTRQAILTDNADASTVMHEMLHHFVGVNLEVVNKGYAPAVIVEDVDTMMRFWKMEGDTPEARLANWNSMSFEDQAPHQEALSYNYELWLFNGTAPTVGLKRLFERVRTFMVGVYTSLVEAQRKLTGAYQENFGVDLPDLTPEVREMFERMVGGELAAQKIEAVREMAPMFATQEEFIAAGNDEAQWERYQQLAEDAHQQLVTDLDTKSLQSMQWANNAQGKVLKAMQSEHDKKRRVVQAEVTEEVKTDSLYVIMGMLQKGTGLDRAEVVAMIGAEATASLKGKVRKDGVMPDDAAALDPEAFPTGRHLVDSMVAARPIKAEIEARTAVEMQRRYGEPMDPESVALRVEEAVHSEARSRFVAADLGALDAANRPAAVMNAAADEAARKQLANMPINEISPTRFAQLETRAAAKARAAMKPVRARKASEDGTRAEVEASGPDPAAAFRAKNQQLLYNRMAKQAVKAREEIAKSKTFFKKVAKDAEKKVNKTRDPKIVHIARAVLSSYGLLTGPQSAKNVDFMQLLAEHAPDILERYSDELVGAMRAGTLANFDHRNMTLEQFQVLREMVESIYHRAKLEKQIIVEGKRVEIDTAVDELLPTLEERRRKNIPSTTSGTKTSAWGNFWSKARAALSKVEHWAIQMDGGKLGAFHKYLFQGVKDAVDAYRADATEQVKKYVESIDNLRASGGLPQSAIPLTDITDKDGKPVFIFGDKGSRGGGMAEFIGALLHTFGNESNKSKFLFAGRGVGTTPWAVLNEDGQIDENSYAQWDKFVQDRVDDGTLTRDHFEFLQSTWDLTESIKPQLQKAHIRLHGYPFKEVKAAPFQIKFPDGTTKTYRGGYVPAGIDYDAARETGYAGPVELTEDQLKGEFLDGLPKVAAGMTKARVEGARKRPLTMDLSSIGAHIDKSLRYAHVAPAVDDMARLMTNDRFKPALAATDPDAWDNLLVPFMRRAVTQTLYKNDGTPAMAALSPVLKHMRKMTGISIMALNWVNSLQQLTGISNALIYVKARYLKGGLWMTVTRPRKLAEEIANLSDFMADRLKNQMFGLTEEMRAMVASEVGTGEKVQTWATRNAYILQATMQNLVDTMTWKGAYDQATAEAPQGLTLFELERRAVREADSAVRQSQGSFSPEDVAGYEEGTALMRLATQFTSYFNTVLNQLVYSSPGAKAKVQVAVLGFVFPMIIAEAIAMTFYDKWDDEDDDGHIDGAVWANLFGYSMLRGGAAMAPGVGGLIVNSVELEWGDRPFGDRVVASPAPATIARGVQGVLRLMRDATDENKQAKSRTIRDAMTAIVLAIPGGGALLAPAVKPLSYGIGIGLGETEPTSVFDTARGLATGYASEGSKR